MTRRSRAKPAPPPAPSSAAAARPARPPFKILFVCTGNSARSQMAEGLAQSLGGDRLEVHSAGTLPIGVNSHAVAVMRERGIDIARQYSKGLEDVPPPFDLVITLCDAAASHCPRWVGAYPHEHWSTPDPSFVGGKPEAVRRAFRDVRDRLETQIQDLIGRVLRKDEGR
jgi:thioredoxin type arsenate reductase